ncbi:MAG: amidohydrolase family protein [Rhodothermales bacterium]
MSRYPNVALFVLSLWLVSASQAQPVVLKAARLLDVETGRLVAPAALVVEDGRIAAVNAARIPAGAEVIDLGDMTLLPGLMDMHTHLTFALEGDWVHDGVVKTPADLALMGAYNARKTLMAGITTVRDVGSVGFADVSLARAIDAGQVDGPSIFPAGHSIGITGGHCDATGYAPGILESGPEAGIADGPDEATKAVRYQIKHGAKVIKICATAGVLSFEGPVGAQQLSAEEMRAIVEEAGRHGLKVAAHAHGSDGILAAVRAGVASIEHGSILTDEIIAEMKQRGTYLVPTTHLVDAIDMEMLPPPIRRKAEEVTPLAVASLKKAIAAGVPIAMGTDATVMPHGDNMLEFVAMVDRGMAPLEAIRSGTTHAADLLGVADRGRLAEGLRADIIAVRGNPLEDIRALETVPFVMKGGVVYKK